MIKYPDSILFSPCVDRPRLPPPFSAALWPLCWMRNPAERLGSKNEWCWFSWGIWWFFLAFSWVLSCFIYMEFVFWVYHGFVEGFMSFDVEMIWFYMEILWFYVVWIWFYVVWMWFYVLCIGFCMFFLDCSWIDICKISGFMENSWNVKWRRMEKTWFYQCLPIQVTPQIIVPKINSNGKYVILCTLNPVLEKETLWWKCDMTICQK